MNAVQSNTQTETTNYLATLAESASPYLIGVLDAECGHPFAPETYFFWWGDMLEYTEGFEEVKGQSDITCSFKAQWPAADDTECIEDDYQWIARGC